MFDLIIIGGSAAGVAAAIYAKRRNLNFSLLSTDIGGEVATSGEIENYLGFPKTDGIELAQKFKEQLKYNNIQHQEVRVEKVEKGEGFFTIKGKQNGSAVELQTKTVLVATGVHPRELSVPGEKDFRNKGVSYCTVCDGPVFKDKVTATIGGGNSGMESVLMLAEIASKCYLLQRGDTLKGDEVLAQKVMSHPKITVIFNANTKEIFGEIFVKGLRYEDTKTGEAHELAVDGVFVHIGMLPNADFIDWVEKNEFGEIKVDTLCRTNVPGVFTAGDVTDVPYKQITIAAGQGTCAALAAVDYLNRN
ncbi:MAG: FAD-dependent oxidoreductase [Candidatus Portnoybacteria bacterium]|nr:FAD-dependent oxidoreductase [Candidatus Portnoybacteria bacterium]